MCVEVGTELVPCDVMSDGKYVGKMMDRVIDRVDQWGTCSGPERGP